MLGAVLLLAAGLITTSPSAAEEAGDRDQAQQVVTRVLESERSGVEVPWQSVATGRRGVVVAEPTYYLTPEQPCRDYVRTLERSGAPALEVRGTGCREGYRRWQLSEEEPTEARAPRTPRPPGAAPVEGTTPPGAAPAPAAGPATTVTAAPITTDDETGPPVVFDYTMPAKTEL